MKRVSIVLALLLVACGSDMDYEDRRMLIKTLDGELIQTCDKVLVGDHERLIYCYEDGYSNRSGLFPVEEVVVVQE